MFIIVLALLFAETSLSKLLKKPIIFWWVVHLLFIPSIYSCRKPYPSYRTWVWSPFHCSNNLRLPSILPPYKTFALISLRLGFHQGICSLAQFLDQVVREQRKTTSPPGELTTPLHRSCLDSSKDSWAALSFQMEENKDHFLLGNRRERQAWAESVTLVPASSLFLYYIFPVLTT